MQWAESLRAAPGGHQSSDRHALRRRPPSVLPVRPEAALPVSGALLAPGHWPGVGLSVGGSWGPGAMWGQVVRLGSAFDSLSCVLTFLFPSDSLELKPLLSSLERPEQTLPDLTLCGTSVPTWHLCSSCVHAHTCVHAHMCAHRIHMKSQFPLAFCAICFVFLLPGTPVVTSPQWAVAGTGQVQTVRWRPADLEA